MKSSVRYLTVLSIISVLFLALSGLFTGVGSSVLHILAFVLPVLLFLVFSKKEARQGVGLYTKGESTALFLPFIFPTILLIFLLSLLSSIILTRLGLEGETELSGSLTYLIFKSALLPAILEEALYRYVMLAALLGYSRRGAVVYSAIFFAFAHCNLFQIPYALLAGAIFALLDIVFDSVLPSVIIHFLNNVLSILWIVYFDGYKAYFIIPLVSLAVLSLFAIFLLRKKYKKIFTSRLSGDKRMETCPEILIFIVMTVFIAVTNLL